MLSKDRTARHITLIGTRRDFFASFTSCIQVLQTWLIPAAYSETKTKKVAIVIDDFGNNMDGTAEMMNLPIPFTVAVMPFLPSTKQDAQLAHDKGHEVILHLPMEPVRGKKSWLGPGAITTDLSNDEIHKTDRCGNR